MSPHYDGGGKELTLGTRDVGQADAAPEMPIGQVLVPNSSLLRERDVVLKGSPPPSPGTILVAETSWEESSDFSEDGVRTTLRQALGES